MDFISPAIALLRLFTRKPRSQETQFGLFPFAARLCALTSLRPTDGVFFCCVCCVISRLLLCCCGYSRPETKNNNNTISIWSLGKRLAVVADNCHGGRRSLEECLKGRVSVLVALSKLEARIHSSLLKNRRDLLQQVRRTSAWSCHVPGALVCVGCWVNPGTERIPDIPL